MMKINCQEKFVVLDKMDAIAQAGHMTNEYSKYKAIHMFYTHPSILVKIINTCCVLSALAAPKYEHVCIHIFQDQHRMY